MMHAPHMKFQTDDDNIAAPLNAVTFAQLRRPATAQPLVLASQGPACSHAFGSGSTRQAATQRLRASAAAAATAAIDPNSHRVMDTELKDEAEKSYLAVRACRQNAGSPACLSWFVAVQARIGVLT